MQAEFQAMRGASLHSLTRGVRKTEGPELRMHRSSQHRQDFSLGESSSEQLAEDRVLSCSCCSCA